MEIKSNTKLEMYDRETTEYFETRLKWPLWYRRSRSNGNFYWEYSTGGPWNNVENPSDIFELEKIYAHQRSN